MDDIDAIVAKLTKAQKRAIIALADKGSDPYGWRGPDIGVAPQTLSSLTRHGLADSSRVYGGSRSYLRNDRTLAVRSRLMDQSPTIATPASTQA